MHMEPIVWARRNVSKNVDPVAFRVTWGGNKYHIEERM